MAKILCTFNDVEIKVEMSTRPDKNQRGKKPRTQTLAGAPGAVISHSMKNESELLKERTRHVCELFCVGD